MSTYQIALLLHLLGAFCFVSGAVLTALVFETARRRTRPSEIALLLGLTRLGVLLVLGGAAVLLGGGLWLANHLEQASAGWVVASLVLFALSLVLGAVGGRRPKAARHLAKRLAEASERDDGALRALLDDGLSRLANYGSSALVLALIVVMVWQPGR